MKKQEKVLLVAATALSFLTIDSTIGCQYAYRAFDKLSLLLRKKIDLQKLSDEELQKLWDSAPFPEHLIDHVELKLPRDSTKRKERLDNLYKEVRNDLLQLDWDFSYFDALKSKDKVFIFFSISLPILALFISEPPPLLKASIDDLKSHVPAYLKLSLSNMARYGLKQVIALLGEIETIKPYLLVLSKFPNNFYSHLTNVVKSLDKEHEKAILHTLKLLTSLWLFYFFFIHEDNQSMALEHLSTLKGQSFSLPLDTKNINESDDETFQALKEFYRSGDQLAYLSGASLGFIYHLLKSFEKKQQMQDALEAKEEVKFFHLNFESNGSGNKQEYLDILLEQLEECESQKPCFLVLDRNELNIEKDKPALDFFNTIISGMNKEKKESIYSHLKIFVINVDTMEAMSLFSSLSQREITITKSENDLLVDECIKILSHPSSLAKESLLDASDLEKEVKRLMCGRNVLIEPFLNKFKKDFKTFNRKEEKRLIRELPQQHKHWIRLKKQREKMEKQIKELSLSTLNATLTFDKNMEIDKVNWHKLKKTKEYRSLLAKQINLRDRFFPMLVSKENEAKKNIKACFTSAECFFQE